MCLSVYSICIKVMNYPKGCNYVAQVLLKFVELEDIYIPTVYHRVSRLYNRDEQDAP